MSGTADDARSARFGISVGDLARESLAGLAARPGRAVLTAIGTVLGVAALVGTLGLTDTVGHQIIARLDSLAATEVVLTPASDRFDLPDNSVARLESLDGVRAVAMTGAPTVTSVSAGIDGGSPSRSVNIVATTPSLDTVNGIRIGDGRWLDARNETRADRVAVLGGTIAATLGILDVDGGPAVTLDGTAFTVIGIMSDTLAQPELLDSIVVPLSTARARLALDRPAEVRLAVERGRARTLGAAGTIALSPNDPSQVSATVPPDPRAVRRGVEADTRGLFLALGAVSLLVGAVGIANVTLVAVLERRSEIGLRRALGARPVHIAAQFLGESAVLGALGGAVGAALASGVVLGVAAAKSWDPVLDLRIVAAAPLLGLVVGLVAGLYPALKAAAVEPITALRSA